MKNNNRVQSINFFRIIILLSLCFITEWQVTAQTPVRTPTSAQTPGDTSVQAAVNARVAEIEKAIGEGHLDPAMDQLNEIIKANPNNANAYVQRASIYQQLSKLDLAKNDLKKALEFDPRNAKAYAIRGAVASNLGDSAGCIADSTRSIELDPKLYLGYYNRGTMFVIQHDATSALKDLTKAIELSPQYSNAYLNRSVAKGYLGDPDGKIDDLVMALETNPNNQMAQSNLKIMLEQNNDQQIQSMIRQRVEALFAKDDASKVQSRKLAKALESNAGKAEICELVKQTLPIVGEMKAAWQRALFVKHLNNYTGLEKATKYVNDISSNINDLNKVLTEMGNEYKCGQ